MILIQIHRDVSTPIYRQIIDSIIKLIEEGSIRVGDPLPPTRILAQQLGIDRSTVYRAYQELYSMGYVESVPGSYTRVRKRPKIALLKDRYKGALVWKEKSASRSDLIYQTYLHYTPEYDSSKDDSEVINLSQLDLDAHLFPLDDFKRSMSQAFDLQGEKLLCYGSGRGYQPLRETIANRLRMHGIAVIPNEILITNGAQQALELILKLFTEPGDKVVVESPTYANLLPLLRFYLVDVDEIPMREDGMDLDLLEQSLDSRTASFLYTIPNFQNPTGISTSQGHRERLLSLCEKHDVPIVEDGFEEEMKYFGKVVLPIMSMDERKIVLYVGTFSKVLFPGIRIGWIAADEECIERLTAIKRFSDISTSHVVQVAMYHFLQMGYYDLNLRHLHRVFRKRMQIAIQAMESYFPARISWTRPMGGYTIWVRMLFRVNESLLKETTSNRGVLVSPGSYYFNTGDRGDYFRISIASLEEDEIREGIHRLGLALKDLQEIMECLESKEG
jgi:DNA-binding transcriptional MocR family regulator